MLSINVKESTYEPPNTIKSTPNNPVCEITLTINDTIFTYWEDKQNVTQRIADELKSLNL